METFEINNRRYLGNKYKLLPFIRQVVDKECENINSVFDVFSGTGSVAFDFRDKQLFVNDMMYSNYVAAVTWFSPEAIDLEKLDRFITFYNSYDASHEDNYMYQNFADTYFSKLACQKIGFIRDHIESEWKEGKVNFRERAAIITSMIYAMDRIANTYGHYDSFIRSSRFQELSDDFILRIPDINYTLNQGNQCFNEDSNQLAPRINCDLAYLDPPYNSRNYCDAYHLLENVAMWKKPKVEGVARKMDRSSMKSEYCKSTANLALEDLVNKLNCRYILMSYNNNGKSLQMRSNAKISDDEILRILSNKGDVQVFTTDYRPFSAGRGKNENNQERLFLCTVRR